MAKSNLHEVDSSRFCFSGLDDISDLDFVVVENSVEPKWNLDRVYDHVLPNGYVFVDHAGMEHAISNLKDFRKERKITTPVQLSKNFMWWWQKR